MEIQKLAIREQIVKHVVKSGNGGAVWVPKNWLGEEVIIILPDKPKLDIKEKVIHLLEPYLKDVIAVFIYGSYARHEETKESDVDVMLITKDRMAPIQLTEPKLEIAAFQFDKLKKAIEKYPVMYYQIVQEAVPLINSYVLEELKNVKISNESFKNYLNETKEHIESSKELIELDRLDGSYIKSYSALYSIILRLRGIFIIRCISGKEKFSNAIFQKWLMGKGVTDKEYAKCYAAYRTVKTNASIKNLRIKISVAEKLLDMLAKETMLIGVQLNGE